MLRPLQITTMTDEQMDEFLKRILARYVLKKQDMNEIDLVNALLNFAVDEGMVGIPQSYGIKNVILDRVNRVLTDWTASTEH